MRRFLAVLGFFALLCGAAEAFEFQPSADVDFRREVSLQPGGAATGPCGGDLGSNFPNCTVVNLSNVTNGSLPLSGINGYPAWTGFASLGITAPVVNTTPLTISGYSLTGSNASSLIDLSGTWNTSGSAIGIKFNATCTSCANAQLIGLQVGGVRRFDVDTNGIVGINGVTGGSPRILVGLATETGRVSIGLDTFDNALIAFGPGGGSSRDTFLTRSAAASWHLGGVDAAAPVAQTLGVQGVVAGTSNTPGANWLLKGSDGTGTGVGGTIVLQTAPAGTTGTTQNPFATGLTITAPAVNMQPSVVVGNQALATNATDGFLYIASGAGTPTGTPTTFTGRVALYYDTTNHQLWVYDGAWLQPKTPAAAAIVNWQ
jgi:hypothetical protein